MGMLDRFRKPVTAAAVKVLEPSTLQAGMTQSREVGEAWRIYRELGEIGYVVNQQARLVGRLDWTMTVGGGEPIDTEKSDELLRAAFGQNLRSLNTRAAICLQVAGAYVLARTRSGDPESWRVFSSPLSAKNKKRVEASDVVVEVRIEDPEEESRNDSPVLRSMNTARELLLTRAQSRAWSRSRTAQHGLLIYPTEGTKDPVTFEANLQDTITAPLADERTTASVTPNIIGFPAELIEKWKTLSLSGEVDKELNDRDARLVRSLGVQLDVPPEVLTGFADSNHWSTWAIMEDNWLGHIEPAANPIGQALATAIMKAAGGGDVEIEPDPGPLLQRRPTTADALAAYAAGLVSGDWAREQLGADETDAPAPQEVQVETPAPEAPAAAEPAAIAAALRGRLPTPHALPVVAAAPAVDARALAAIDTQAYDALEDLVNDSTERALERLGAKARSFHKSQKVDVPDDVSNAELAVRFEGDIPNADATIADTIASTAGRVDRIIERAFLRTRSAGVDVAVDPDDLRDARDLYASLVADAVSLRLAGKPSTAAAWQAARRVVAVAGGNGDTAALVAS